MSLFKRRKIFYIIFSILFYTTPVAIITAGFWVYSLVRHLPNPEIISTRNLIQSTKIYDRTGKVLLYEIHGNIKRTYVPLKEIPKYIQLATIAAEDINFYHHHGLDFKGILRAAFKNIIRGEITQGGSTITQQLIKNSLLGNERTFVRKIKEQILALLLEKKYSKDEILELYLNQIPYGSNAYGIAAAADLYFSKKVNELTLNEAAVLAALPRAPTYYSPYGNNKDKLIERKNWILNRMSKAGFISKNEAERAKNEKLVFAAPKEEIRAPHFVFYVKELLDNTYGKEFVEKGGLKVITTLDWELQKTAEKIIKEGAIRNKKLAQAYNAALVALDPRTGEILAMVGSRDYYALPEPKGCTPGINCKFDPHVNVTLRRRQPGSAFKPFVYATAFKKGYTPETVLFDVFTEFNPLCNPDGTPGPLIKNPKDCYHPGNFDGKFRGPVTIRQALAQSLNVPSVKLLYLTGIKDSIETAKNLGITTLDIPERYGLSLVLGGAEVTLLEMTSAFGAFAQDGILHQKTPILRIENSKGVVLEEKKNEARVAMDTEVARTINDILSDNEARAPIFNPQGSLYFPGRQVAAKTGTTQNFRDGWVIGYTPSFVAGVWVGNNDNSPIHKKSASIMVAGPIWHEFMAEVLKKKPPENFTPPAKITPEKPVFRGIYRNGPIIQIDKTSNQIASIYTPPELIKEVALGEVKPILYFVDKDNPVGEKPQKPEEDPQYKNWEVAIKNWLSRNKLTQLSFPSKPIINSVSLKPEIKFETPSEKTNLVETLNQIEVDIKRQFPLKEILLFINEELVGTQSSPIVSEKITFFLPEKLAPGNYVIKIVVFDAIGNRVSREREITVLKN